MRTLRALAIGLVIVLAATCDRPDDLTGPDSSLAPEFAKGAAECTISPSAKQRISALAAAVDALVADGTLNKGVGNALQAKLSAALQQIDKCNAIPAINQLEAFINHVEALVSSGRLSGAQGGALIDAARAAIAALDGTAPPPPPPLPDLRVGAFRVPADAPLGGSLTPEADIANAGTGDAAAATARFRVLDANTGAELASQDVAQGAIAAGGAATLSATFDVGAAWPVAVVVEITTDATSAVDESDETNNAAVSPPITILAPELEITSVAASATSVVFQCKITVEVTAENTGNATAAATQLRISLHDAATGTEFAGTTTNQPALAPGAAFTFAVDFAAAAGWSSQVLLRGATDVPAIILERDETNNTDQADGTVSALIDPPAGFTKLWICGASTSWAQAANWRPQGAPLAADDVYVPAGTPFQPALSANVSVNDITIEDGASLTMTSRMLTASGNVSSGLMTSPGTLVMTGAGVTLGGMVPRLEVTGQVTLSDDTDVQGAAILSRGSRLRVAGRSLAVSTALSVQFDNGQLDGLIMTDAADDVDVDGNATLTGFGAASSEGSFSAGTLHVGGNFSAIAANAAQSQSAFVSTGTTLVLDGAAGQFIALGNASSVRDFRIENSDLVNGVRLARNLHVTGQLIMVGDAVLTNEAAIGFDISYHSRMPSVNGPGYRIDDTRIVGNVIMDRDVRLENARNRLVVNQGGRLTLAGHRLEVANQVTVNLYTPGVEGIVMANPADELIANGDFLYAGHGGSSEGDLTAGIIRVRRNFTHTHHSGSREVFVATGTTVIFDGDGTAQVYNGHTPQKVGGDGVIIPGTRFSDLVIAPGAFVDFGLSSFANTSEMWVDGTADWYGEIRRRDSGLDHWVVAQTLILRAGFTGLSNSPICYGALVNEGGAIGHDTNRINWTPLQQLGTGDCKKP